MPNEALTVPRAGGFPGRNRRLAGAVFAAIVISSTLPVLGGLVRRERTALAQMAGQPVSGIEPRLVLNDDGGSWDAASFRERVTILNFWATWCPPCLDEMPLLEQAHREWGDLGLRVFGVTTFVDVEDGTDEELAEIRRVLETHGVSYPVLISTEQKDWDAYRVEGLPVTVLVDSDGIPVDYAMGIKGLRRILKRAEELLTAEQ